jgi:DtxR family Mn-dependent transcriptional regulator
VSTNDISPALGRYLEAIYYLDAEGEDTRQSRIAEWLGVSLPTVSASVGRLVDAGLLTRTPSKTIAFTTSGRTRAARTVRTHRIVERWLTDELGLDWLEADTEAGRLEHAVSDAIAERLFERMGRPATCPHGNPIPGAAAESRGGRPLSALVVGERSHVRRVSEVTEHEAPMLLRFLADHGFGLEVEVQVVSADPGAGALAVEVAGARVAMSTDMAQRVWVD